MNSVRGPWSEVSFLQEKNMLMDISMNTRKNTPVNNPVDLFFLLALLPPYIKIILILPAQGQLIPYILYIRIFILGKFKEYKKGQKNEGYR